LILINILKYCKKFVAKNIIPARVWIWNFPICPRYGQFF